MYIKYIYYFILLIFIKKIYIYIFFMKYNV